MDVQPETLPDGVDELKRLVHEQRALLQKKQSLIERKQHRIERGKKTIERKQQVIELKQRRIEQQSEKLSTKQSLIERLEEQLRKLQQQRFGKRSEKHPGQAELQLFNEAELLTLQAALDESETDTPSVTVPEHTRKCPKPRVLPKDLPRVEVIHDLDDADKVCACGQTMTLMGHEILEQLAVIPLQYYVIRHKKCKYACVCKTQVRTARLPKQPLPASQASPQLLAQVMVAKYHDGLPLYRQEKMASREGLDLPRGKLARWMIEGAGVFQPLWNLMQDTFFSYDIAASDETGLQVLKEEGRAPETKSYLWIRRGGPPDKPVVLVDYSASRSGATASSLLDDFKGYLICDAYSGYNPVIRANGLLPVYCNDHARRKFVEAIKGLDQQDKKKHKTKEWVAKKAINYYKVLYRIERQIKGWPVEKRHAHRQAKAVGVWDAFIGWAQSVQTMGVAHAGTREALGYLLNHAEGLRRYCIDGRLPISNIQAEHVAKAIAIPRKNFLFADTPAGADASARIYSILESAKANGHHPQRYLSVLLTELPNVTDLKDIEALLPWALLPEEVNRRYAEYPTV